MAEYSSVRVEKSGAVGRLTLVGPGKGNAMGPDFWRELPLAVAELDTDPEVRVVILTGEGKHFSFGLDLMGMMSELGPLLQGPQLGGARLALLALIERMQAAITSVEKCRKPVIAEIGGWCIGGGVDLVTAADIRLCSEDAKFSVREVKLAIVAEGIARELAFTGRDIDAAEAERIGLVNRVCGDREALAAASLAMAEEIAGNSPLAVLGSKRVLNWSADHPSGDGLAYVAAWNTAFLQSEDLTEALTAFMERREPVFTGK